MGIEEGTKHYDDIISRFGPIGLIRWLVTIRGFIILYAHYYSEGSNNIETSSFFVQFQCQMVTHGCSFNIYIYMTTRCNFVGAEKEGGQILTRAGILDDTKQPFILETAEKQAPLHAIV